ncbi:hypothetical protein PISMIDRAFT_9599 [Pisolithus microcarpus 441]|uniref:Uncharacterized protein n=1 Tax=Pisolithus microcarpus 441 TaxID=765257 RepID=A0A0C9ZSY0_9AGAM|nr:hypothetical protein PISMIDRAFT_9599 [Pisolithus microcarpus 441]
MHKGISDLMQAECSKLLVALNDTEDSHLCIQSVLQHKAALISSDEPVIISTAPPSDSNKSQGKQMFCNLKTDWLGPKCLVNKAATQVKKSITIAGSVKGPDEVNSPEGVNENTLQKETSGTNQPKCNLA